MRFNQDTPTRLPPPPRRVHGQSGCLFWFLRLFILPHTIAGVFILGQFLMAVLIAAFGTDTMAVVTEAHTSKTSKGGTMYNLSYRFEGGGRTWTNSDTVGATTYTQVTRPQEREGARGSVQVKYLVAGPVHYHLLTENNPPWSQAGEKLFFALFWNGIVSIFVYLFWIAPIRMRLLVRRGEVARGTVVGTRIKTGKSTTYYVKFRFKVAETSEEVEKEMTVPAQEMYEYAHAGLVVTVIYDPRKPRRALAYELSGYGVEGASSRPQKP